MPITGEDMTGELGVHLGKLLVIVGVVIAGVGLLVIAGVKFPALGLGRLPGDIVYKSKSGAFYFPVLTCAILSVALTLIVWFVSLITRR
ncbi:MAG: DUF2905 domain-containing protein [Terriglobia bacterium]